MGFEMEDGKLIKYFAGPGETVVTIPEGVTRIESYAFEGNDHLTSVVIPDTVTDIFGAAFVDCSNLTEVTLPPTVEHIGQGAFTNNIKNSDLIIIHASAGSYAQKYAEENGIKVLII